MKACCPSEPGPSSGNIGWGCGPPRPANLGGLKPANCSEGKNEIESENFVLHFTIHKTINDLYFYSLFTLRLRLLTITGHWLNLLMGFLRNMAQNINQYVYVLHLSNVHNIFQKNVQLLFSCCWQECHLNWKKQIYQLNITGLKILTGERQTSWLFTSSTKGLN